MPRTRNIIIFVAIGAVLVLAYIFFMRNTPDDDASLVLTSSNPAAPAPTAGNNAAATEGFLTLLLNVKNIKLNDAVFSDVAFISLDGSHSINLTQDGTEGRTNPFAPLGSENVGVSVTP